MNTINIIIFLNWIIYYNWYLNQKESSNIYLKDFLTYKNHRNIINI